MSKILYIECINCGKARYTNAQDSIREFEITHFRVTGHGDFYSGPMPNERAQRLGLLPEVYPS